ncbi:hypothetical protein CVT24_006243 [Panaeolus cyanescens]|uniref:Uncharacterized protein n=1 Tax=Panaeolus cyanescens TaxID=181874 RepID=A0A409YEJ6_9AGAR|nr:hypothetical protein CVT24_006243 [Panaeolus cyanescens]
MPPFKINSMSKFWEKKPKGDRQLITPSSTPGTVQSELESRSPDEGVPNEKQSTIGAKSGKEKKGLSMPKKLFKSLTRKKAKAVTVDTTTFHEESSPPVAPLPSSDHDHKDLPSIPSSQVLDIAPITPPAQSAPEPSSPKIPPAITTPPAPPIIATPVPKPRLPEQIQTPVEATPDAAEWLAEKKKMEEEIKQMRLRIAADQEKLVTLQRMQDTEKLTSQGLKAQAQSLKQAHDAASQNTRALESRCRELQDKIARMDLNMREKARAAEENQTQLQALLDVRTNELKGAQSFLTMVDKYSGADVVKMVEVLNAEIFQTSAYMSGLVEDILPDHALRRRWENCLTPEALAGVRAEVGEDLVEFIGRKGPDIREDPLPLQIAIQSILVWWSAYMVNGFCDGLPGEQMMSLYENIRRTEPQTVAARWRTITTKQLATTTRSTNNHFILRILLGLLRMGGWSDELQKSAKHTAAIQESIAIIEKAWHDIKVAVKEGVISCDLELVYSKPGIRFDSDFMEDSYADGATATDTVLCTIALGLKRSTAKASSSGFNDFHDDLLVKPKVVLSSLLLQLEDFGA